MTDPRTVFASAAHGFAALVRQVPDDRWDDAGLGEWTVRDLVGHTSRSLITVSTYLRTPAEREDTESPAAYYVWVHDFSARVDASSIVERGRRAGQDLGADPAGAVDSLVARTLTDLDGVGDPLIEVIGGQGIRLSSYLPTRTFELAVHSLDIARAVGIGDTPPADVLTEAAALAAQIGVALGHGPALLLAMTGRADLPGGFSVV